MRKPLSALLLLLLAMTSQIRSKPSDWQVLCDLGVPQIPGNSNGASSPFTVTHAVSVRDARTAEAILLGYQNILQRSFTVYPGWYALHVSRNPSTTIHPRILLQYKGIPSLKVWDKAAGESLLGKIVGLMFVGQSKPFALTSQEPWAADGTAGLVSNIILASSRLQQPLYCAGSFRVWQVSERVAKEILLQIPSMQPLPSATLLPAQTSKSSSKRNRPDSMFSSKTASSILSGNLATPAAQVLASAAGAAGPSSSVGASTSTISNSLLQFETNTASSSSAKDVDTLVVCGCCAARCASTRGLRRHFENAPSCRRTHQMRVEKFQQYELASTSDSVKPTDRQSKSRSSMYSGDMQSFVLDGLSRLRLDSLVSDTVMSEVKEHVRAWLGKASDEIERRLAPSFVGEELVLKRAVREALDVFRGLETSALEEAGLKRYVPFIEPVERRLGTHTEYVVDAEGFKCRGRTKVDRCYDLPLSESIARLICYDSRAWEQICSSQEDWRSPMPLPDSANFTIADIPDGSVFNEHPELGKKLRGKATHPDDPVRLAIGLYYDGLETSNPLGVARGRNSLGCFYAVLFNLDPSIRMGLPYIIPVTLALEDDIKRYGATMVVSGATKTGSIIANMPASSFGAQMRQFDNPGFTLSVPDKEVGYSKKLFRGWCIRLHADFPAAAKLLPFMQSASAHFPSRGSNWSTIASNKSTPSSFLLKEPGVANLWKLRTQPLLEQQLSHARKIKLIGERKDYMKGKGLSSLVYALQPSLVPHFKASEMAPMDGMHGEPDGLLNEEAYGMVFSMVRIECWTSIDEINALMGAYNWPPGHRPPPLHSSAAVGTLGNLPSKGSRLRYTASQMLHWAKHSLSFLRPVVRDPSRPFWQSWRQHVRYLELLMQYLYTHKDVLDLDRAIHEHQRLFTLVAQYEGWFRPKHAFAQQYAIDTLRCGPMRLNWCMRFEAFNQIIKRFAEGSNYKNLSLRCLTLWSLRSARHLRKGSVAEWGQTRPIYSTGNKQQVSLKDCKAQNKELYSRFFGAVVPMHVEVCIAELEAVEYLGDLYMAHSSWVLHESVDHANLGKPALARVESILELSAGMVCNAIYIQLHRYPHLELHLADVNILKVNAAELTAAATEDELLYLEWQIVTPLQHNIGVQGENEFLLIR